MAVSPFFWLTVYNEHYEENMTLSNLTSVLRVLTQHCSILLTSLQHTGICYKWHTEYTADCTTMHYHQIGICYSDLHSIITSQRLMYTRVTIHHMTLPALTVHRRPSRGQEVITPIKNIAARVFFCPPPQKKNIDNDAKKAQKSTYLLIKFQKFSGTAPGPRLGRCTLPISLPLRAFAWHFQIN